MMLSVRRQGRRRLCCGSKGEVKLCDDDWCFTIMIHHINLLGSKIVAFPESIDMESESRVFTVHISYTEMKFVFIIVAVKA